MVVRVSNTLDILINNLRTLINASGMSQTEISEKSGLRVAYLNQILKGRNHSPHLECLVKLSKTLDTSVAALFTDPNLPPPITPQQAWVVTRAFMDGYFFMQPKPGAHSNNTYKAREAKERERKE